MKKLSKLIVDQEDSKLPMQIDPNAPDESAASKFQGSVDELWGKVSKPVSKAMEIIDAPKKQLIDAVAPQLDLQRNSVMPQGNPEFQQTAKMALDMGLPAPSDALLLGAGKLASKVPGAANALIDASKGFQGINNQIGSIGKKVTAAEILANSPKSQYGKVAVVPSAYDLEIAKMKADGLARKAAKEAAPNNGKMTAAEYILKFGAK